MRHSIAALLAVGLGLAACDKAEVDERNASIEDVANAVADAGPSLRLEPGRWESTTELVEISAPGMPPQAVAMMKKSFSSGATKVATCLKPEDVDKPGANFFGQTSKDCRFDHYRMDGGAIDAHLTCAPADGQRMAMTMTGRYSPTSYEMEVATDMAAPADGEAAMTMRMRMKSTHTGPCEGEQG